MLRLISARNQPVIHSSLSGRVDGIPKCENFESLKYDGGNCTDGLESGFQHAEIGWG